MALPPTPYDACEKIAHGPISMVRYRNNDYSVPTAEVRGYVHEVA